LDNRLRPVFVLIKGIKSDDGFRIGLVVYGDPLQ
jgi:hypothetical protein